MALGIGRGVRGKVWGEVPRYSPENLEQSTGQEKCHGEVWSGGSVEWGKWGSTFWFLLLHTVILWGSSLFGYAEANLRLKFRKMGRRELRGKPWTVERTVKA